MLRNDVFNRARIFAGDAFLDGGFQIALPDLAQSLLILQQSQARSDHLTGVVKAA